MFEPYQLFRAALLAGSLTCTPVQADTAKNSRAEVAAALKGMAEAANAHDVDRHVGFYAHDPHVTLIVDGEPILGWDAIRDKQREWWNDGKTDVVYAIEGPAQVRVLATKIAVTTLLMKGHATLPSGKVRESHFAVSSIWKKLPEGWRVIYSHESTTR